MLDDFAFDKINGDIEYAFMYHEVTEAKRFKREVVLMEEELLCQIHYDRQESGYYDTLEIERRMDVAAWEQILYMDTHSGYLVDPKPYVPNYVTFVENIDKLINEAPLAQLDSAHAF